MKLRHKALLTIITFLSGCSGLFADAFRTYIETYSPIAIEHQQEYGIPASITLAQGILESSAGRSVLAKSGNNHFGIKCHKDWRGRTMYRDDDKPNECFRVYNTPEESFLDHSLFLKRVRYQSLFSLEQTDYKGWARGLKKCGYATDPNYADRLITIIERYALYNYDGTNRVRVEDVLDYIYETLVSSHPVRKAYGLHYVVAVPGDSYASIAQEFGIKENKLRSYNDAGKDDDLVEWEEIYLQPKNTRSCDTAFKTTIGEGENMRSIAQHYGITLKALKALNKRAVDEPGTTLRLK